MGLSLSTHSKSPSLVLSSPLPPAATLGRTGPFEVPGCFSPITFSTFNTTEENLALEAQAKAQELDRIGRQKVEEKKKAQAKLKAILGEAYFAVAQKILQKLEEEHPGVSEEERAVVGTRRSLVEFGKHVETVRRMRPGFGTVEHLSRDLDGDENRVQRSKRAELLQALIKISEILDQMVKFSKAFPSYPKLTPNLMLFKKKISNIRHELVHNAFTTCHEFVDWEKVWDFMHDSHIDYLYNEYVAVQKYWDDWKSEESALCNTWDDEAGAVVWSS